MDRKGNRKLMFILAARLAVLLSGLTGLLFFNGGQAEHILSNVYLDPSVKAPTASDVVQCQAEGDLNQDLFVHCGGLF